MKTRTLSEYWKVHPIVEQALRAWIKDAEHAHWAKSNDVIARFPSADPIGDNRVVFNIKGKKYRLIVKIHYNTGVIFIRFIGTHAEYSKINAEKV